MTILDPEIYGDVVGLMNELAGDWEYDGDISASTRLLGDLGLESLDLVVLGTTIQGRYGQMPFSEFLAEIGQRPVEERDITVGELVGYVAEHRRVNGEGGW
jgi:acyl carrier protein